MVRITCIKKDCGNHLNPHEGITDFGWVNEETRARGQSTRTQMVYFLESQNGKAYVKDSFGKVAYIRVWVAASGIKYLQTYADDKWSNNLLSLPEC